RRPARPAASRRAAAAVALVLPLAAALVAGVALSGHLAVAALALGLVVAANGAIWFALTERGARRTVGAVAAVLSLGGLIAVFVTNWQGLVVLVLLVLLLAGFGLAAGYALESARRSAYGIAPARPAAVGGAGSAVLIINPKSGGGKAERFDLAAQARRRDVEPIVLGPGDDLLELAENAIDRGARVIGMAGGDGSQALVATVASRHDVAHVCVPAGTRNHFALDLGLDRDDVLGALDAYTDGVAKLETWTRLLPDLLGPEAEPIDLEFTLEDGSACADAALVLVSNNPYELTHLAGAGTRARIDTGTLGVVAARVRGTEVAKLVALELVGQAGRFPGLLSWSTEGFEVRSGGPVAVGLDGEAIVLDPPLRFTSLPGALQVRLPESAGLAPAARAVPLTSASFGELFRVAAGR